IRAIPFVEANVAVLHADLIVRIVCSSSFNDARRTPRLATPVSPEPNASIALPWLMLSIVAAAEAMTSGWRVIGFVTHDITRHLAVESAANVMPAYTSPSHAGLSPTPKMS